MEPSSDPSLLTGRGGGAWEFHAILNANAVESGDDARLLQEGQAAIAGDVFAITGRFEFLASNAVKVERRVPLGIGQVLGPLLHTRILGGSPMNPRQSLARM
jgi:hypothetical protein